MSVLQKTTQPHGKSYQLRLYLKLASQLSHTIISSVILNKASYKMFRALAILASIVGGECNALTAS